MKQVIVAFGGSFNPPTNSHFSLAEQIRCSFPQVHRILFIPVSDLYPKKDLLEAQYRVEMLKLVCDKNPYFKVSTIETRAPVLLNSIETLRQLQEEYKAYEIWLTLGTDNLKVLTSWPGYKEILERFKCLVLERDEDCFHKIILENEILKQYKDRLIKVKESIHSDASSTLLRNKLREGKSIRYMLPDEVYFYIKEKGLYTIISTLNN